MSAPGRAWTFLLILCDEPKPMRFPVGVTRVETRPNRWP